MTKEKEGMIEAEGTVVECVRSKFKVKLDGQEHIVLCHPGGKVRKNFIRVVPGDHVAIEMSPYDLTRGRVIWRDK